MFTVYHSNQLDLLKTLTSALIARDPLADPFQQEVVLVQSPGMAQWLQMQLAEQFGIAANIAFPLPATFIWDMFTRVLPDIPKESAFSKDAMTWKLMWLLPELLTQPAFAALQHYLTDDGDKRKIHQLAGRVADLFDQYLVYRPQWLESWQRGERIDGLAEAQQWQAPLWARLVEYTRELGQPEWHRANLYSRFINALDNAEHCPPGLPPRVFICGISALPPVYLEALQALGRHIDIHLMFTNPCRYYWGDIQDYAFLARLQSRKRRHYHQAREQGLFREPGAAAQLFDAEGQQQLSNPLLASWGKLGRDHLYLLSQMDRVQEVDAFVDIPADNMLHAIQRDMLELEDHAVIGSTPETLESSAAKRRLEREDRSLSLHACHSPQREVEVLHDQLLTMLAEDPALTPRDIIVMVADIDSYTPTFRRCSVMPPPSDTCRLRSPTAKRARRIRRCRRLFRCSICRRAALPRNRCWRYWRCRRWRRVSPSARKGCACCAIGLANQACAGGWTTTTCASWICRRPASIPGGLASRACCLAMRWTAKPAIGRAFCPMTNRAGWWPNWPGSWRSCWPA